MFFETTAIGNLGADAKVRTTQAGQKVVSLSLAINERWKDQQGVKHEKTIWLDCAYWRNSENLLPYLKKGTQVLLKGKVYADNFYSENQRQHIAVLKMRVDSIQLLSGQKDNPQPLSNAVPSATSPQSAMRPHTGEVAY